MGLAIGVIYLSALIVVSLVVAFVSVKMLNKNKDSKENIANRIATYVGGLVFGLAITIALAMWSGFTITDEWGAVIWPLVISIICPSLVGMLLLLIRSFFDESKSVLFSFSVIGALSSTFVVPFVGVWVIVNYDELVTKPAFKELCQNSGYTVLERINESAESISLLSNSAYGGFHGARSINELFLESGTPLKYFDHKQHNWDGTDQFIRTSLVKKDGKKTFIQTPISAMKAEFLVVTSKVDIPDKVPENTFGNKIEIFRTSDNKLISYGHYYWNNPRGLSCPDGLSSKNSTVSFIARTLNVPYRFTEQ